MPRRYVRGIIALRTKARTMSTAAKTDENLSPVCIIVLPLLTFLRVSDLVDPVIDASPLACRIESPSRQPRSPRSGPRSETASPSCQTGPFVPTGILYQGSAPAHDSC